MAQFSTSTTIARPADDVRHSVRDFGSRPRRHPAIADARTEATGTGEICTR